MFDDRALLDLWDAGLGCGSAGREALLVAAAGGAELATPGQRNAALLRWRQQLLGRSLSLRASCPRCAGELEVVLDSAALCAAQQAAAEQGECVCDGRRWALRAPTVGDLHELAARHGTVDALAHALLQRCAAADGHAPADAPRAALAERLEALDPCASIELALACPDCGHAWRSALDVPGVLWAELRRRAETLLADVAALAREYGWREADVLALPPARRAAYLQLAGAA